MFVSWTGPVETDTVLGLTQLRFVWSVLSSPPATAAAQGSILSSAGPEAAAGLWRPRQARHALSSSQPSMSSRESLSQPPPHCITGANTHLQSVSELTTTAQDFSVSGPELFGTNRQGPDSSGLLTHCSSSDNSKHTSSTYIFPAAVVIDFGFLNLFFLYVERIFVDSSNIC